MRPVLPGSATLALAFGLLIPSVAGPARGQAEAEGLSASFRKASKVVLPAVVTVRSTADLAVQGDLPRRALIEPYLPGPNPRPPRESGGSGLVVDAARGLILTNDHLIDGSTAVVVVLADGRERPVSSIRRDPKSDLAVLAVDPAGLAAQAEWGDSDALETGDWVLAVGQPFGLSGTVTAGIVSGKGRGIGVALYEDLIQTDAAINPGNSGGPLVNLRGQVVGINTAIKTLGGGYEGVGFAVPASRARRVAADLVAFGRVRRSYLGVTIRPVDLATADRLNAPGAAVVSTVTTPGPADAAGVRPGDVIVGVGGKPATTLGILQAAIEVAPVGEPLEIAIDRGGRSLTLTILTQAQPERLGLPELAPAPVIETGGFRLNLPGFQLNVPGPSRVVVPSPDGIARPDEPQLMPIPPEAGAVAPVPPPVPVQTPAASTASALRPAETAARSPTRFPELGLRLSEPTPALIRRFGFDREPTGLIVTGVEPEGPGDRGGLEVGMVVTDVADRKVDSVDDFREAVARRPPGRDLLVRILKGEKPEFRVIVGLAGSGDAAAPPPPTPAEPKENIQLEPLPGAEARPAVPRP